MVTACFLLFDTEDAKKYSAFSVAIYLTGGTLVILHVVEWWVDHPRPRRGHKDPPHRVLVPAVGPKIPPYDPRKPKASWMETDISCPDCGRLLIRRPEGDICVDCEGIELPPDLYPE